MSNDSSLGPAEEAGLRWLLRTSAPIVCAMLAVGPLPLTAIVRAWRDAAARSEPDEPYLDEDDLHASLQRLSAAGYVSQARGEYALTRTGAELADQVDSLYRALHRDTAADAGGWTAGS